MSAIYFDDKSHSHQREASNSKKYLVDRILDQISINDTKVGKKGFLSNSYIPSVFLGEYRPKTKALNQKTKTYMIDIKPKFKDHKIIAAMGSRSRRKSIFKCKRNRFKSLKSGNTEYPRFKKSLPYKNCDCTRRWNLNKSLNDFRKESPVKDSLSFKRNGFYGQAASIVLEDQNRSMRRKFKYTPFFLSLLQNDNSRSSNLKRKQYVVVNTDIN